MLYLILLIVEHILVEASGLSLNCTNDYDKLMSCNTDAENCTRRTVTIYDSDQRATCAFHSCVRGCCCSTKMKMLLSYGDEFSAEIFEDEQMVHSQTIKVEETIKPKAPHIDSFSQSHGIYQIKWRTNMRKPILGRLMANVTYKKIGGNIMISEPATVSTSDDKNTFEILGRDLEPSTTYVIFVKTYTSFGFVSDSSNVVEFTTASAPTYDWLIALILCLSVAAIVISGVLFTSFFKLKGKLWDKAASDTMPKLLDFKHSKKVILKPESLSVDSLSVEPPRSKSLTLSKESLSDTSGRSGQTSGISTASSSLDYANTEPLDIEAFVLEALKNALPNFVPSFSLEEPTQSSTLPPPVEKTPCPIVFDNKSYLSTEINQNDDVNLQMTCDSGYHLSDGPTLHDFINPPHVSAVIEMDMSYQPCAQSEEASGDSLNLLPVIYSYQEFDKLVELSSNTSSVREAEDCQLVLDQSHFVLFPQTSNDIFVDHAYHCV